MTKSEIEKEASKQIADAEEVIRRESRRIVLITLRRCLIDLLGRLDVAINDLNVRLDHEEVKLILENAKDQIEENFF